MRTMNTMEIYKLYEYYYLYNIHNLINQMDCSFNWINLNDYKYINTTGLSYKDFDIKNLCLNQYSKNKIGLAKDILENGMYFPFFGDFEENKIYIKLGKHRLYSLLTLNKQEKINQEFLIIYLPINTLFTTNKKIFSSKYCSLYDIDKHNNLKLIEINNYLLAIQIITSIGEQLSEMIFFNNSNQLNKYIKPSFILNDKESFNNFINKSFNE